MLFVLRLFALLFGRFRGFFLRLFQHFASQPVGIPRHENHGNYRQRRDYRRRQEDLKGRSRDPRIESVERIYPYAQRDYRTHHHGHEHGKAHSHALEAPFEAVGDIILEGGHERAARAEHGAEHDHAAHIEHGQIGGLAHEFGEIDKQRPEHDDAGERDIKRLSAELVEEHAHDARDDRGDDDHDAERQHIIGYAQGDRDEIDEIGHKSLLRDTDEAEGGETDIHELILFRHMRAETVKDVGELFHVRLDDMRRIFDEKNGNYAADDGYHAENDEKESVIALVIGEHGDDDGDHRRKYGHDRKYRVDLAAVGAVGDIRDPGVESRVIRRRAGKSHDAVENDQKRDHHAAFPRIEVHGNDRKKHYRKAPDDIACGDKRLSAPHLVAQRARKDSRDRGGERGQDYHQRCGDIIVVAEFAHVFEKVLGKGGEIHVFYYPGYLTDQPA